MPKNSMTKIAGTATAAAVNRTFVDIPPMDRLAWSPREFAALAGFSIAFIYREIEAGRLRLVKHGTRSSILRDDGLAWLHADRAAA